MQLIDFAIRRRVTIVMCTVAIALFGLVSLSRLKLNLLPDLSYPTLTVRTELTGAAPLEIENLITRPVEEAVGIIRNVRQVRSVSRSGQSDVILEFVWGTDMDLAGIDVREKLDLLQLPLEAKRPLLLRFDPSSEPVMRLAFLDETAREDPVERLKSLRRFAEDRLKPDLEAVEGSAAVKVSGGYEDEVQVFVDQQKLAQLGLSIDVVTRRIRAENVNLSGGRLEQGMQRFLVRTLNEFEIDRADGGRDHRDPQWPAGLPAGRRDGQPRLQGPRGDHARRRQGGDRARRLQGRRREHGAARRGHPRADRGDRQVAARGHGRSSRSTTSRTSSTPRSARSRAPR